MNPSYQCNNVERRKSNAQTQTLFYLSEWAIKEPSKKNYKQGLH